MSSSRPRRRRQSQRRRLRCAVAGGRVTAPHHHRSIRLPPHRPSAPDPAPRAFSSKSSAPFLIRLRPACAQAVQETKAEGQIGPKPVADEKLDPAEVAISEDEKTKTLASCDLKPQVDPPASYAYSPLPRIFLRTAAYPCLDTHYA